jgi:hexosaminidase
MTQAHTEPQVPAFDALVLLPMPQATRPMEGMFHAHPSRFICIRGDEREALLRCGSMAQQAIEQLGQAWPITAGGGDDVGLVIEVDPAQIGRPEAYRLTVFPGRIVILAHDAAGAFYACQTLRQLCRLHAGAGRLPCLRIDDWPDFPSRGAMLDISRDRVPTMQTLFAFVDLLAEWKINQFQLYTEHTFAYRRHRKVWEQASPMTGEQILALDRYCRERFIELVPNQNSFSHTERWLQHEPYKRLAEAPDGFVAPWGSRVEQSMALCPLDPGSLALVREWYAELLPHFTSAQVNVGCDETWELGQGRSKAECEKRGVGRVYLDFLLAIHDLVRRHGRTMQFWGDIIMKHPELIPELPEGIIALEWGYEADHPFDEHGRKFADAGVPFYVCPGTGAWNTFGGRTNNAIANLINATSNGLANGAIGVLNTAWGDNGNREHLPVNYLGFAFGGAVSWSRKTNEPLDLPRALSAHVFHDQAGVMGQFVYDLGNAYLATGAPKSNGSVLFTIVSYPYGPVVGEGGFKNLTAEGLRRAVGYLDELETRLGRVKMDRPDAALLIDEFRNELAMMRHGAHLGIARAEHPGKSAADLPQAHRQALLAELEPLMVDYRRLWLARSCEGGLADSVARFEALMDMYRGKTP